MIIMTIVFGKGAAFIDKKILPREDHIFKSRCSILGCQYGCMRNIQLKLERK